MINEIGKVKCQHIYKINPFSRDKKCLKCGIVVSDMGIIRNYKKHLTKDYKIKIW